VIDPTNICNLRCPLCPTGQNLAKRKGMLPFEKFKEIVDELGKYLFEIDLYNWGEPLLNREVYKMIEYSNQNNIRTTISSNLNTLNEKGAEKLINSGLDRLTVSLDGATRETYNKYRIGGDFQKVIGNMKMLVSKKKELGKKNPYITWQFLISKQNEHEIEKARELSKKIGIDYLDIKPMRTDMGKEIFESDETKINKYKKWLPTTEKFSRYDMKKKKRKLVLKSCLFLWTQSVINWEGDVLPCCSVFNEKFSFGNAFDEGFLKVWNNDKYRKARHMVKKMETLYPEIVCSNCIRYGFVEI
jgi:radical SAM protein with 4Fe4S-binding SPASM domain